MLKAAKAFSGMVYTLYPGSKDTAAIACYRNGKEDGDWKQFYRNGKLMEQRSFRDGVKTGNLIQWWENGRRKRFCSFEHGEYNGAYKEWNEAGILIRNMHYKAGYESGIQQQFYDNGKVRSNYVITGNRRYGLLGTKNCVNVSDSIFKQ